MDKLQALATRRESAKERWQNRTIGALEDIGLLLACGLVGGKDQLCFHGRFSARQPLPPRWPSASSEPSKPSATFQVV